MLTPDDHALLNDLLDERLPSAEEQALLQRLEREPSLREAYDQLVRLRTLVERSPDPEPPPGFLDQVRERLRSARDDDVDGALPERRGPAPVTQPPPGARVGAPPAWGAAASADAAPASDGRLRPLPRVSHEPGPTAWQAGPVPTDPVPADPAGSHPAEGVPENREIPVFWRRMMTVAYAAAALLVVGVGLLAVRDRERDASRTAQGDRAREQARARRTESGDVDGGAARVPEEARQPRRDGLAKDGLAKDGLAKDGLAKEDNSVPPPATATFEASEADGDALEAQKPEAKKPQDAASEADGRGRIGFGGPGGAVPPGLRAPSDEPLPAPPPPAPAPAPAPPGATPSGPAPASGARTSAPRPAATASAPRPSPPPAERSAPGSKPPAPRAPAAPAADAAALAPLVLVLEADDLASGRALLAAVVSGPGPRVQRPGAAAAAPDFTRVRLRRLEPARDAALLAGLSPADRAGLGAQEPHRSGAPPPRTAQGGGGAAPLSAPAATAPLPGVSANGLLLGLEPLDLSPEELARLEALLGPAEPRDGEVGGSARKGPGASGSGATGSGAGDKAARAPAGEGSDSKTAPARRAVRVLITRAR